MSNSKEGYIYIYKCIVGTRSDVIKIGKTKHFNDERDRMKQHGRTLYYGFVPYTEFTTGYPISTAFKVKNKEISDKIIKDRFKDYQLSNIEIYNIEYEDAIKIINDLLKEKDQYLELIEDNYTNYDFLKGKNSDIRKEDYEYLRDQLLNQYNGKLPEEVLVLLRDKEDFIKNCSSHYNSGNYIDSFPKNMILDIHYNKSKRQEIFDKLKMCLKK